MLSIAKLKYLRIAPRKVRLVADLIRGEKVEKAQIILDYTRKKAAIAVLRLLNQAVSNAKDKNLKIEDKNLYISKILVDEGPRIKRTFPRARGRADVIHKKTSHLTIVLDEIKGEKVKEELKPEGKRKKRKSIPKTEVSVEDRKEKAEKKRKEKEDEKAIEDREPEKVKEKIKWRPEKQKLKPKTRGGLRKFFRRKAI